LFLIKGVFLSYLFFGGQKGGKLQILIVCGLLIQRDISLKGTCTLPQKEVGTRRNFSTGGTPLPVILEEEKLNAN
jgi:hypothetical protein